jgi:hypothetical protein
MTRASRTVRRVFWACAGLVMPLLNPPLILLGEGPYGVVLALAATFMVLWFVAQLAWTDPGARRRGIVWGMLAASAGTVVAAVVEFLVVYAIAAANCPPDAYECPF